MPVRLMECRSLRLTETLTDTLKCRSREVRVDLRTRLLKQIMILITLYKFGSCLTQTLLFQSARLSDSPHVSSPPEKSGQHAKLSLLPHLFAVVNMCIFFFVSVCSLVNYEVQ